MLSSPPAGALANPVETEARARFLAERPGSRKRQPAGLFQGHRGNCIRKTEKEVKQHTKLFQDTLKRKSCQQS